MFSAGKAGRFANRPYRRKACLCAEFILEVGMLRSAAHTASTSRRNGDVSTHDTVQGIIPWPEGLLGVEKA